VLVIVCLAQAMVVLDTTVVNVAPPAIQPTGVQRRALVSSAALSITTTTLPEGKDRTKALGSGARSPQAGAPSRCR
jgi:hypothetical protein